MLKIQGRTGQLFEEIRREPYERKNGKRTELIVWQSVCSLEGCEEMFEVKTPIRGYEKQPALLYRHCPSHRMKRAQSVRRAQAATRKLSNEQAGTIRAAKGLITAADLARQYQVSISTVYAIWQGHRRKPTKGDQS